jgi:lysophospholipase L1-like esterase
MRKRWQLWLAVAIAPIAATVAVALPAHAAGIDYVALGDSYASGTGVPPYSDLQCTRSTRGYPVLWAIAHSPSSFANVSCGGATTADVLNKQLSPLNAGTDLVTLQIGGNDVNFATTILACGPLASTAGCITAINSGLNLARTQLPGRLDNTYAQVRSRAPNAKIVVIGYVRLVEPNGDCLSQTKRTALNSAADELNTIIKGRVQAAGANFVYIDAIAQFAGHGACGNSPWLHTLSLTEGVMAAHPNLNGNQFGYLPLLNAVTG